MLELEVEVEKSFWLSRPDGWVINRKTKKIIINNKNILLEFKRTSDAAEAYFQDMWKVAEKQHTPILTGLLSLAAERGWEVDVVPLVVGSGLNPSGSLGSGTRMGKCEDPEGFSFLARNST
jgi:hypothetical protein